jgi:hypothetical protein
LAINFLSFIIAIVSLFFDKKKHMAIFSIFICILVYIFAYWIIPSGFLK